MESTDIKILTEKINQKSYIVKSLQDGMHQAIVGQAHLIDALLIGLLADVHIACRRNWDTHVFSEE